MPDDQPNQTLPAWYSRLPPAGQFMLQLGFAGLFAAVFLWQQFEGNRQAREERAILWEEIRSQRVETVAHREEMRRAVDAMNRAVEEFRRQANKQP